MAHLTHCVSIITVLVKNTLKSFWAGEAGDAHASGRKDFDYVEIRLYFSCNLPLLAFSEYDTPAMIAMIAIIIAISLHFLLKSIIFPHASFLLSPSPSLHLLIQRPKCLSSQSALARM